nr:hypothetical protein [uncultured Psychroserpens sp.]
MRRSTRIVLSLFLLISIKTNSQDTSFTCSNNSYKFLDKVIGHWNVITKDRISPNVYENNKGVSIISNAIEGCSIKESYRGVYKGKQYAREVTITGMDSLNVQMVTLDSEHSGFSIQNGSIINNVMTTIWYRNENVKRLQSKYILSLKGSNAFEFSSYLSTDYGKTWALTHERTYAKINH